MNLLGPSPDIWARKTLDYFSSVFEKISLGWVPVAVGGGSNVGRGTTSSASHQTLLVLN